MASFDSRTLRGEHSYLPVLRDEETECRLRSPPLGELGTNINPWDTCRGLHWHPHIRQLAMREPYPRLAYRRLFHTPVNSPLQT
jgi:hypothetical protein